MKYEKYVDDNGELIFSIASDIPGITIVPPGKKLSDAIAIDETEHQQITADVEDQNQSYVDPKQVEIEELKAKVDGLQADVTAVKEVTLDTIPNKDQV